MECKHEKSKKALLAASVAGLLAITGAVALANPAFAAEDKVHCYGANKCKGMGDCGGKGHSCAGKNACKGQGYVDVVSKEACLKMEGGRLTAEPVKA